MTRRLLCALFILAQLGCSDGETEDKLTPLDIPEGCQPIAAEHDCMLPFPSDFFTQPAADLPSGRHVRVDAAAQPENAKGGTIDFTQFVEADGFSPGSQILALFPSGLDESTLTFHTDDVTQTLEPTSRTQIIDAETGEAMLHFAEVDPRGDDPTGRALVLRPLVRLQDGKRYIVALSNLTAADGSRVPAPEGFRRIVARRSAGDPVLEPLAKRYEKEIFPVLAARGIPRAQLTLSWDFTVRSEQNLTRDMLSVRDMTLAYLASGKPKFEIVTVTDDPSEHVARRIDARVSVPLFLEENAPLAKLTRDADGGVRQNGMTEAEFSVFVPKSVATRVAGTAPARLMQYGHGFFGSVEEVADVPSRIGHEKGFVVVATNWIGMSTEDRFRVVEQIVTKPGDGMVFVDRAHQGMANAIVVGALAMGDLASAAELQFSAGPAYDATALYYYGNSMGHILGGTYLALSPHIERGVLGVGGANLSNIMFRARPLAAFILFIGQVLPDALGQQKFAALGQLGFDRLDPLSYAPRVLENTLDGSPAKREVLLQIGMGDSEVNPLAAHLHARALSIPSLAPAPRAIAGLSEVAAPHDGSALAEYDFGIDPVPGLLAIPPTDSSEAHEGVRRLEAAKQQLDAFLRPGGQIVHACSGVCDPE
jgi:hypothetical protein